MRPVKLQEKDVEIFLTTVLRNADKDGKMIRHFKEVANILGVTESITTALFNLNLYSGTARQLKTLKFNEVTPELVKQVFRNHEERIDKRYSKTQVQPIPDDELKIVMINILKSIQKVSIKVESIEAKINYINDVAILWEEYLK